MKFIIRQCVQRRFGNSQNGLPKKRAHYAEDAIGVTNLPVGRCDNFTLVGQIDKD